MANENKAGIAIDEKYCNGYIKFDLSNVVCFWVHLDTPDTAFGNNKWCLEMRLEDEVAEQMKAIGFDVKDKVKDGVTTKNVLKAKKEVLTRAGKEQTKPKVVGPDGRTLFTDKIGNGSVLNLQLSCKAWPINGAWQLSCYVDAAQVVILEEYTGGGSFGDTTGDNPVF